MKEIVVTLVMLASCLSALELKAETPEQRAKAKHEVRIGWGDQMFESVMWHNPQYIINNMPESATYGYKERYRYTQHIFAEYQYRPLKWLGVGGMLDFSGFIWDSNLRNGKGELITSLKNQTNFNVVIMPTVRFSYCNINYFSMYSGLGIGLDINTGSETDGFGHHTVCAPAFNLTLVGASVNYEQWFLNVELGAMAAMRGMNYVYMLGSRLVSVSVGLRF